MKTIKTITLMLVMVISASLAKAQATSNNIDNITNAYLAVKNALIVGNGTAVQGKAKDLLAVLSNDPDKGLKPDQKKLLDGYLEKLKFDSRHMSEVAIIDHQREHFASLSKNMYDVLKGLKMNTSTVYEQYCPMKKAYWLSESPKVKNPYYSDKEMATCGRTTATLAAAK
jgi:hypothetical protein